MILTLFYGFLNEIEDDGDKMTKNIFTEITYTLSPTRSISQSLKTFGINDKTTDMFVIVPDATPEALANIRAHIDGTMLEPVPKEIEQTCDQAQIQTVYNIGEDERQTSTLVDSVVSRIACRDVSTTNKGNKH